MPLTVLSVAYPFAPVGPAAVGGAEEILTTLDRALTAQGHTSIVAACEGSASSGTLYTIPLPEHDTIRESDRVWCRKRMQAAIDRAIGAHPVDLIHMHGLDFPEYALPARIPKLVTLHMPLSWYPPGALERSSRHLHLCCVSESQRRSASPELGALATVENGIDLPAFRPDIARGDYAVVLGRICPEKNAHAALDAGTLAGVSVLLAGQVFPYAEHRDYFDSQIAPRLAPQANGVQHRFLGPIDRAAREQLLARARCLLHPTVAPETSSLVAMEALAAGTPVIAFRSGALPELVSDGLTGFLVDTPEQMAAAISRASTLSAQRCRAEAERRFPASQMVQAYLRLYKDILHASIPQRLYA